MQALRNPQPAHHRLVECECPGPGYIHVLDGITDGFDGKEGDREVRGQGVDQPVDDPRRDERIRLEGQVRSVLFMGAERQDGNPFAAVDGQKRRIVVPEMRPWVRHLAVHPSFRYAWDRSL